MKRMIIPALFIPYLLADLFILLNRIFKLESLHVNLLDTIYGYIFAYCMFFIPLALLILLYLFWKEELRKMGWYSLAVFLIYFISLSRLLFL